MFGAQTTGSMGFGQQASSGLGLGGAAFGQQQPQTGTGNPPFEALKVWFFNLFIS